MPSFPVHIIILRVAHHQIILPRHLTTIRQSQQLYACCRYSTAPRLKEAELAEKETDRSVSGYSDEVTRVTGYAGADKALHSLSGGRINLWMQKYESLVGLTEVKEAQNNVMQAENLFRAIQTERRSKQQQMTLIHTKLKDIHAAIDKVQRGDEAYLALLTEEYEIIKQEKKLAIELAHTEQLERDHFAALSSAVRESHEKERSRAERTKYWSVIGSIIGAAIGIIGTSINNYVRMKELKGIVTDSASSGSELKGVVAQLSDTMAGQYNQLQLFVAELRAIAGLAPAGGAMNISSDLSSKQEEVSSEQLQAATNEILGLVREQDKKIGMEMSEIKKMLAMQNVGEGEREGVDVGRVVYVGPEIEGLLEKTEESLEWKIKTNALVTAVLLYGAGALTLYLVSRVGGG